VKNLGFKVEICRKKKTSIPGNEFRSNNSEAMRVVHSSWIRFRMDLGMEGLSPSSKLYEQEAGL
jgi:hypothetical protein